MSQSLLVRGKVPEVCPDHCSSTPWLHAPEAAYAPLYKADARAEARTIESPFSQTLTTNNQENKSRTAAEKPVNMCTSISLEGPAVEACTAASGDVLNAQIDAALRTHLTVPEPSMTPPKSPGQKRIVGLASAPIPPRPDAPSQRAQVPRSVSMKTAKSVQKAKSSAKQAKEVDDLHAVLRYNMALQARMLQMEKSLAFKDKQVGALTQEMRMLQDRHEKEGSIYQDQGTLNREDPKTQSLPANLLRSSCSASSLDLDAQLLRLRMLFDAHSLYKADPTGRSVEEGVMWQLKEHVKQGCQMAEEILTPGSVCHHALPLTIMEHSGSSPDQAALWLAIAQKLQLSQAQRQRIADWRTSVHKHMQNVQNERHAVLSQMMHTLLPRGLLLHADAPRTFSEQLLTLGTLPLMKVNADAAATAKRLEENLAQERKLFAGANTVLLQSILSPVQAGLLMLDAWPAHCDCFAFATVALNEA
ncbi:g9653 [Coccomyxa viridis]|uniref:G9653 protein n=1 Tax=Coccomyxa viridis TaxID=1274662 RepID=A0ABP1G4T9_9CHLO